MLSVREVNRIGLILSVLPGRLKAKFVLICLDMKQYVN